MSINPFLFNKTIKNIQPTKEDIKNQEQKLAKLKDNFKIDTSATYGFNYGLEFTGELKENKSSSSSSSSVASNINTNKFRIKLGNKATIQGSNINANDGDIDAKEINILASKDESQSSSSSKSKISNEKL